MSVFTNPATGAPGHAQSYVTAILELLARLASEAHAAGGALIQLLGNHELMNAAGDFRYVTPAGMREVVYGVSHLAGPGVFHLGIGEKHLIE